MGKKKKKRSANAAASVPGSSVFFTRLAAGILGVWALIVLWAHFKSMNFFTATQLKAVSLMLTSYCIPAPGALLRHLLRLACLALLGLAAWGAGRAVLRRFMPAWHNPHEEAAVTLGIGLGVLAYLTFFAGILGLLYRPVIFVLVLLPAAAGLWDIRGRLAAAPRTAVADELPAPVRRTYWAVLGAAVLLSAPYMLAPETHWDALVYHLNLPNLYLLNHGIIPTPTNVFAGIPSVPQMLYVLAMGIKDPIVARLLNCALGIAVLPVFFSLARRWRREGAGLPAAAFFLLAPVALYESYRTSVGLAWALFQLLALYSFIAAVEEPADERRRWWLLCGVFTGLTMGTKYPAWGLPFAMLPAYLYSRFSRLEHARIRARELALVCGAALLVLSPWIVKNAVFYGNPVFPYLQEHFTAAGGEAQHAARAVAWRALNQDAGRNTLDVFTTWRGLKDYLLHPWIFTVRVINRQADQIGPIFLLLLPLLFLLLYRKKHVSTALLTVLFAGLWIPLSLATHTPRFMLPHLAPLCILLACAVMELPSAAQRKGVLLLCGIILSANVLMTFSAPPPDHFWEAVSGRQDEDDYLHHSYWGGYPNPPYAGIKYLNEKTPPGSRVVLIGDSRGLYLERDYISSTVFDTPVLEYLFNSSTDPADLRQKLRAEGITHFMLNAAEMTRLKTEFHFTPRGRENYAAFWMQYTEKVFEAFAPPNDHWVVVFKILDDEEAARPHKSADIFASIR